MLPVRLGGMVAGVLNSVVPDDSGWVRVGGGLTKGAQGSFSLSQKGGQMRGMIIREDTAQAYVLEPRADGGLWLLEKPLSAVRCATLPRKKERPGATGAAAAGTAVTAAATTNSAVSVPLLDSLPGSTHVVYLDFDGELVTDPEWNSGFPIYAVPTKLNGKNISPAQITDVWLRVSEDFKAWNISITTDLSRYNAAPPGQRMRCVVTSTDAAGPGAGGIAYIDSFADSGSSVSSTIPCWAFTSDYYNTDDIAGTISHELGHTFGLSHDGQFPDDDPYHVEYYSGHGSWGPLMGVTYDRPISQWCKGEYPDANNFEDDIVIIGNSTNGFFVRTDEASDTPPGPSLPNTGTFSKTGIISSQNDIDCYTFTTSNGVVALTAAPAQIAPDLDISLELRNSTGGTILKSSNPAGVAKASIIQTVTPGAYTLFIRSSGMGATNTGYTAYGSIGEYTLSGTFPAVPDNAPTITQQPLAKTVPLGAKVTFSITAFSNTTATYQWTKDNVTVPGQKTSTLTIASAQVANEGDYRCIVTNSVGSTPSEPANLSLNYKPVFTLQPLVKPTTTAGTDVTLTAAARGTPTVTFQWQFGGANINGATGSSYTVVNPQWPAAGVYRCVATNAFGSTISATSTLTVTSKPYIFIQPPTTTLVPQNGSATISLTAAGTGALSYKWFFGASPIAGATKPLLSLAGISPAAAGSYHCEIKNAQGTTLSNDCVVTVQASPFIVRDLQNLTLARNAKATLSLGVVGAPVLHYEWRKNGLKAGVAATFVVTATEAADYQCIVTNSFGNAISATAHITIHEPVKILTQPLSQIKAIGSNVEFTVAATPTSTAPFTYLWKKNNIPLPSSNSPALTLPTVASSDAASYTCTISNDVSSITSTAAKLTLQTAPAVTIQSSTATVLAFSPATFTATATGTATLKYQWQKADKAAPAAFTDIAGATAAIFKIASAQTTDDALYRVRVTNSVGSASSAASALTVTPVSSATLTGFHPTIGKAGHLISVKGTNLNWTTGVTLGKTATTRIAAAFSILSPSELLITIPPGAITSSIQVTTRNGTVTTSTDLNIGVGELNDAFVNARLMLPGGGSASGNNDTFTAEPNEPRHTFDATYPSYAQPYYNATYSGWFEWTPSVSGSYNLSTKGSAFDTRLAVYTGTSVSGLTAVAYNDDDESYDGNGGSDAVTTSKVYLVVTAGVTYHIAVDGFDFYDPYYDLGVNEHGAYNLLITRIAALEGLARE